LASADRPQNNFKRDQQQITSKNVGNGTPSFELTMDKANSVGIIPDERWLWRHKMPKEKTQQETRIAQNSQGGYKQKVLGEVVTVLKK
jgi:hypothetical protein